MADNFYSGKRYESGVIPPLKFILVEATTITSTETLPEGCRGLRIGTAGTLSGTMQDDSIFTDLPVFQGDNPGHFKTLTSGTAQNIWAIV